MNFDWNMISEKDRQIAVRFLDILRDPDYSFLPGSNPYQFRWYLKPRARYPALPGVFLHVMVGDDPTDELHDHDWHNTSHILAGQMIERYGREGTLLGERVLKPGVIVHRKATDTHSLRLDGCAYAMTLFIVGPKVMDNHYWKVTNG